MTLIANYSTQVLKGQGTSELAKNETNDCTVKAVATATGTSYDLAHALLKAAGRENKKGFALNAFLRKGDFQINGRTFHPIRLTSKVDLKNRYKFNGEVTYRRKTVKSFIKSHPEGTFIVLVAKHAFTVKDGVLVDNVGEEYRPTRKVNAAFRIEEESNQLSLF